jgi:predicted ATP-grasp superfamily ATP-dependent carboligase
MAESLLIVGASARAAAFSALRAGLQPWCVDLFADCDLQRRCSATRLEERYPHGFARFLDNAPLGPWMYTGGLENWPRLVERWARRRPLWGNRGPALDAARNPEHVASLLRSHSIPAPGLWRADQTPPSSGCWLLKPRHGASGIGIRSWSSDESLTLSREAYLQEFIEGQSLGLLFLGDGRTARFLGMTHQLVGESWLHAAPFRYCGSIGPLDAQTIRHPALDTLGHLLASACFLEGLFGVDGILHDGMFFPVEINPRYTASVEVLEYATASALLTWHAHVFTHGQLPPAPPALPLEGTIGKAILFARADLLFPAEGPWMAELRSPQPLEELPAFADIPAAGERIEAGGPILTFFARADCYASCEDTLRRIAADLDRWLFER